MSGSVPRNQKMMLRHILREADSLNAPDSVAGYLENLVFFIQINDREKEPSFWPVFKVLSVTVNPEQRSPRYVIKFSSNLVSFLSRDQEVVRNVQAYAKG